MAPLMVIKCLSFLLFFLKTVLYQFNSKHEENNLILKSISLKKKALESNLNIVEGCSIQIINEKNQTKMGRTFVNCKNCIPKHKRASKKATFKPGLILEEL
jgi:hypothetical protein